MSTHRNRVKMTVSGTPGTGTITLSAASSGYQSFATAYGANATVDILIEEGTAWEVARDCTYTNSGTTVTRGTFEASSTGSAVSFTSAAVVSVIATADRGRTWDAAALNTQVAGTDADTTMAINTLYVVDMSAWATADRTYPLPATAAVGDRCGVMITAGDASHELILTAGSGDTLNGIAGGTEWSRLFITNEVVIMRCIVANTTWVVEHDGRIPMHGKIRLTTAVTTNTANTYEFVTSVGGAFTSDIDIGNVVDTSAGRLNIRRACKTLAFISGRTNSTVTDNNYANFGISINGSGTPDYNQFGTGGGGSLAVQVGGGYSKEFAAGDYIRYILRTQEVNKGLAASAQSCMSFVEVFS